MAKILSRLLLLPILLLVPFQVLAQDTVVPAHKFSGSVGLQVNELIQQVVNLDATNDLINNPYLIYAGLFMNNKWGVQIGAGYSYSSSSDQNSPGSLESEFHDVDYRIGVARNIPLGKKFGMVAGADFAGTYTENRTQSSTVIENPNSYDSTMNYTRSEIEGIGGGVQLRFYWKPTNRISVGTETTFYYFHYNTKEHVLVSETSESPLNPLNNTYQISADNAYVKSAEFVITLPVAIFLNIHF